MKVQVNLLYSGSIDGWNFADFHRKCDKKGATILLLKTSKGRICGGFTLVSWSDGGGFKQDSEAKLFSLNPFKVFPVKKKEHAVFHSGTDGPNFGQPHLALFREPMNGEKKCVCHFNESKYYEIGADDDGNSELTGEGNPDKLFTCQECEIYQVLFCDQMP